MESSEIEHISQVINSDHFNPLSELEDNNGLCLTDRTIQHSDSTNSNANIAQTSGKPTTKSAERGESLQTQDWNSNRRFRELKLLLRSETNAKIIFSSYLHHEQLITESKRKLLIHTFIENIKLDLLKDYQIDQPLEDWILDKNQFTNFGKKIAELFPCELPDTYYTPFRVENGERISASGKLVSHFNYVKASLREDGIIQPRKIKLNSSNVIEELTLQFEESEKLKLDYLETHSEDTVKVIQYWRDTHDCRRNILLVQKVSVDDYISQFKALREQIGIDLIKIDFEILYALKSNLLFDKWTEIQKYFVSVLKESKLSDCDKIILSIFPNLTFDQQSAVVFYLLSNIIPLNNPTRSKKRKRNNNETEDESVNSPANSAENKENSKNEKRESFILVISTENEVDLTLENLKIVLFAKKLTLQPLIVIVGSITNFRKIYVVVNNNWYEEITFLNAVDLTFKAFFAFDCQYPLQCSNIWYLIQIIFIYEIPAPSKGVALKVKTISKQINEVLKRSGK